VSPQGLAYTEDVSALYGMAIPMCVEHALTGSCGTVQAILACMLPAADQQQQAAAAHVFPPDQRARVQAVYARSPKLPADWMFLANACAAFGRYHYGLHQIQHFEWVDDAAFTSGCSALRATLRAHAHPLEAIAFECAVEWRFQQPPHAASKAPEADAQQQHVVTGRIDAVMPSSQQPWEFKFAADVTDEHVLQLALYCAMLALKHHQAVGTAGMLFNARTGQLLRVHVPEPALLLNEALAQKTLPPASPHDLGNDAEFLEQFESTLSELLCVT
jgi:hypothetical protein